MEASGSSPGATKTTSAEAQPAVSNPAPAASAQPTPVASGSVSANASTIATVATSAGENSSAAVASEASTATAADEVARDRLAAQALGESISPLTGLVTTAGSDDPSTGSSAVTLLQNDGKAFGQLDASAKHASNAVKPKASTDAPEETAVSTDDAASRDTAASTSAESEKLAVQSGSSTAAPSEAASQNASAFRTGQAGSVTSDQTKAAVGSDTEEDASASKANDWTRVLTAYAASADAANARSDRASTSFLV